MFTGCLAGWLDGWLAGWLVGWLSEPLGSETGSLVCSTTGHLWHDYSDTTVSITCFLPSVVPFSLPNHLPFTLSFHCASLYLSHPLYSYLPTIAPAFQPSTRRHTEQIKLFAADGPFGLLLARYTYDDARVNENSVTSSR